METFWIRAVSQAGIYAVFLLYLIWAVRRGAGDWVPLVGGAIYALVFEHWNMLRYQHTAGGYHYHALSWLMLLGDVPLYIPLAWGFIIATSRRLTDELPLVWWARPFADALFALLIDFSLDLVAIRLHFWYWHGVSLTDGFFGVPADNFLGWLLVTLTFSALTRLLWQGSNRIGLPVRIGLQWLIIPVAAYICYLGLERIAHGAYVLFDARTQMQQCFVFFGIVVCCLTVVLLGSRPRYTGIAAASDSNQNALHGANHRGRWDDWTLHGPRHIFHVFGIIGLLCLPRPMQTFALFVVTPCVWLMETGIGLLIRRRAWDGKIR